MARDEWSALTMQNLAYRPTTFKWKPAVATTVQQSGTSRLANMCRVQAKRAETIALTLARTNNTDHNWTELRHNLSEAYTAHFRLPHQVRQTEVDEVKGCALAPQGAVARKDRDAIGSLKALAPILT